ncbi:hypothetical protein D3C76_1383970 [compost metagenome]
MLEGFNAYQSTACIDSDQQLEGACVAQSLSAQQHGNSLAGFGCTVACQQCAVFERHVFERERLLQWLIVVAVRRQQVQQIATVDQTLFGGNARRAAVVHEPGQANAQTCQ